MALVASSCSAKLTKPKPRDLPSESFMTIDDLTSPKAVNISFMMSSSTSSGSDLTKTLVKVASAAAPVSARSLRGTKKPTKTFLPLSSMPLTLVTAREAASCVS